MKNNRKIEQNVDKYLNSLTHSQREAIVMNSAAKVGKTLGRTFSK